MTYLAFFPCMTHAPIKALDLVGQHNPLYGFMLKFNFKGKAFGATGERNTDQKLGFAIIKFW